MIVTFTKPLERPDSLVRAAARRAGCYAKVKRCKTWDTACSVSFTLTTACDGDDTASFEQHDQVIQALLILDPGAKVKTARAIYESLADFEAQKAARVA